MVKDYVDLKKELSKRNLGFDCAISLLSHLADTAVEQYTSYMEAKMHHDYSEHDAYNKFSMLLMTMAHIENLTTGADYVGKMPQAINTYSWIKYPLLQGRLHREDRIDNITYFGNITAWQRAFMTFIFSNPWFNNAVNSAYNYIYSENTAMLQINKKEMQNGHEHSC